MAVREYNRQHNKTMFLIVGGIILAVLIALFIFLYIMFDRSSKTEINLNECTAVVLTGFNGEGEISARLDVTVGYDAFFDTVKVEFSKSQNLSNGDEIDMTFSYDEKVAKQYRLRVIAEDKHIVIKELVDPVVLSKDDLFEGVEVRFDGIAPLTTATLEYNNRFSDYVLYEIVDAKDYYNVGESVRVHAVYNEEMLADHNFVADVDSAECIKEYVVDGVDRYASTVDDITDDMMASLQKEALKLFTDSSANEYGMRIFCDAGLVPVYINKKTTFTWNSPHFVSSYFNILKEESRGKTGTHLNDVMICYETAISQADGVACNAEVIVRFSDIIIRQDGTVDMNIESGEIISADRRDSHIKAIVQNRYDDDYESQKM